MKFLSLQHISTQTTWAVTIFIFWVCSVGPVINHTGGRTDIFITLGCLPFSLSISIGLTHF